MKINTFVKDLKGKSVAELNEELVAAKKMCIRDSLKIDDSVTVEAETSTGAYWATRRILQILKQTDGTIAKGEARDYPKY